jgi:hypothetical protein
VHACARKAERARKYMDNWQFTVLAWLPWWYCIHVFYSELISKYNAKCKENESLQKQQKKNNALLKEYRSKLMSAVKKQMPLEEVRNVFRCCAMADWNKWSALRLIAFLLPWIFLMALYPYLDGQRSKLASERSTD